MAAICTYMYIDYIGTAYMARNVLKHTYLSCYELLEAQNYEENIFKKKTYQW